MSTAAQRKHRALGPERFGVEAFLPGYVLSGREQERLLDLYDLAHLAEQYDRVTLGDLRRVHPLTQNGCRGKYSNLHVLLSRLQELSNVLSLGVTVKTYRPAFTNTGKGRKLSVAAELSIVFTNPSRTKSRISEYLDSISTEQDVDDEQEGRDAA